MATQVSVPPHEDGALRDSVKYLENLEDRMKRFVEQRRRMDAKRARPEEPDLPSKAVPDRPKLAVRPGVQQTAFIQVLVRVDLGAAAPSKVAPFCLRVHPKLTDQAILEIVRAHFRKLFAALQPDVKKVPSSDIVEEEGEVPREGKKAGEVSGPEPPHLYVHRRITFRNGSRYVEFGVTPPRTAAAKPVAAAEQVAATSKPRARETGPDAGPMPVLSKTPDEKSQKSTPMVKEKGPSKDTILIGPFSSMPNQEKTPFLKHGTMNRVIMKLTDPFIPERWRFLFLRRVDLIMKPKWVLKKLIERYMMLKLALPKKRGRTMLRRGLYDTYLRREALRSVVTLLYRLAKGHLSQLSDAMMVDFGRFCFEHVAKDFPLMSMDVHEAMKGSRTFSCPLGPVELPSVVGWEPKEFSISDYTPRQVAEQLTLIDSQYFEAMQYGEFEKGRWNKARLVARCSPNVSRKTHYFCCIKLWVVYEIIRELQVEPRGKIVEFFLKVHAELRKMRSFDVLTAVNLALTSNAIKRRKKTWSHVSMDLQKAFKAIERNTHVTRTGPFVKLLDEIAAGPELPVSPFMAMYQSKILRTEDQQPLFKNMINVCCPLLWWDYTHCILRFQRIPYRFKPIQDMLLIILKFVGGIRIDDRKKVSDDLECRASDLE